MIQFLTQDKDFFPTGLEEKFSYLREMGFDGFEIDGKLLLNDFEEVQNANKKTGFPIVTSCGVYKGWIGDFDENKRQTAIEDISVILQRLGQLNGKGIVIPAAWGMFSLRLPPMIPPRSPEQDELVLLESLKKLNMVAAQKNVSVFLEPLNRYEDHMINTLEKAKYYIDKGSLSNVSIIADFYHMNIEEAKIEESIIQYKECIKHIHLADSHRYQPGSGHIDFENGFRALKKIGYDGTMAYECRVIGNDPAQAYRDSLAYIKTMQQKTWEE